MGCAVAGDAFRVCMGEVYPLAPRGVEEGVQPFPWVCADRGGEDACSGPVATIVTDMTRAAEDPAAM
jgi:hypothetical protein